MLPGFSPSRYLFERSVQGCLLLRRLECFILECFRPPKSNMDTQNSQVFWSRTDTLKNENIIFDSPWKINMKPTNHLFRKDNDLPNLYFWVLCQFSQVYPFPAIFFGKCRDQPWWCQSLTSEMARCRASWDHWQGSSDWKRFEDRIESRHGSCPCHTLNKDVEWYWKNVKWEMSCTVNDGNNHR